MAASGGHWKNGNFVAAGGGKSLGADDRDRVRSLQDRLISLAERRGISDITRISGSVPADMTVGNLRRFIFPRYEGAIKSAIQDLERL